MAHAIRMPALGQSSDEMKLVQWFKSVGTHVVEGEPLFEAESDKTTLEVEAAATGTLLEVACQPGETVVSGTVIAWLGEPGEAVPSASAPASKAPSLGNSPLGMVACTHPVSRGPRPGNSGRSNARPRARGRSLGALGDRPRGACRATRRAGLHRQAGPRCRLGDGRLGRSGGGRRGDGSAGRGAGAAAATGHRAPLDQSRSGPSFLDIQDHRRDRPGPAPRGGGRPDNHSLIAAGCVCRPARAPRTGPHLERTGPSYRRLGRGDVGLAVALG